MLNSYGKGDLYVTIGVWVPKKLSRSEKEIFESLQKSDSFKPSQEKEEKGFFDRLKEHFR